MQNKKILITFSERDMEMIDFLVKREGHLTRQAAVRNAVSQYYHDRYYSKTHGDLKSRAEKEEWDNMTGEERCILKGGTIKDGQCVVPYGAMTKSIPLGMVERDS